MTEVRTIRLNKFISDSGFCSRREADKHIDQRHVTINGEVAELGTKVLPGDEVRVNGQLINASAENKSDRVYIAYNKPVGITCTSSPDVKGNIIEAINHPQRIFTIGRLDKPSEGLIFLTSDGDIVNKILRAENAHEKEYIVTVNKPINNRFAERMSRGIPILDTVTKPCVVEVKTRFVFKIILTQGLNRQIRRMCEYLGYEVTKLKRVRIMNVELGKLKPGQWRDLTEREMAEINSAVQHSSKVPSHLQLVDSIDPETLIDAELQDDKLKVHRLHDEGKAERQRQKKLEGKQKAQERASKDAKQVYHNPKAKKSNQGSDQSVSTKPKQKARKVLSLKGSKKK